VRYLWESGHSAAASSAELRTWRHAPGCRERAGPRMSTLWRELSDSRHVARAGTHQARSEEACGATASSRCKVWAALVGNNETTRANTRMEPTRPTIVRGARLIRNVSRPELGYRMVLQSCISAVSILVATIAGSSGAWGTSERPAAEGQMSLELSCDRTPPGSGVTFTATIRKGTPEPASVVVAYTWQRHRIPGSGADISTQAIWQL
jgi:hypothetical protein